jgi:hypothetical protein
VGGRGAHVIYHIARRSSGRRERGSVGYVSGRKMGIRSRSAMDGQNAMRMRRARLHVLKRKQRSRGPALSIHSLLPSALLLLTLLLTSLPSSLPPSAGFTSPVVALRTL